MSSSETPRQKTFSIILATYNCGQKVENTLQSILSQNKQLFELIVFDGASTDDTLDFIEKYASDLTFRSEKDAGVYDAFNKAIDLAAGKYLYFIGAGDCLRPNVLEQIEKLLPPETPGFVYGYCYFVKQKTYNGKPFSAEDFARDNLCQQGIFYHRAVFDAVGKFDLRYKSFADWFVNLRCFIDERIEKRYIPLLIADYEEGGLSSELKSDRVFLKEFPLFVRKQFGLFRYVICKLFLKKPLIFNYIYYGHFYSLLIHLFSSHPLPKRLVPIAKSYVQSYRRLKKNIKNKT